MTPRRICCLVIAALLVGACDEAEKTEPKVKEQSTQAAQSPPVSQKSPAPPPAPEPDPLDSASLPGRIHVVQPHDTLLQLAEHYYGNRQQWRKIWQANRRRLSNPNDLPVGMKLIIP